MNKNIIITGANRGLGKFLARYFYSKNYNIVILARDSRELTNSKKEIEIKGYTNIFKTFKCDISKRNQVHKFIEFLKELNFQPNVLINNASIFGPIDLFLKSDFDKWEKTFKVNFFGTAYLTKFIITMMSKNKSSKRSKIINIVGGGASKPYPFLSSYATSKASLIRFTEELAEELTKIKIDINCLAPGPMNTRFTDLVLREGKKKLGKQFYQQILNIKNTKGTSFDLTAVMCDFLISKKSNYLTGKYFSSRFDDINYLINNKSQILSSDLFTMRRIDN